MSAMRCLRFVPGCAEGIPDVGVVAVFPDRLEVDSAGRPVVIRFADIASWPTYPAWWWWLRRRLGWRPRWLTVADKSWGGGRDGAFWFYTTPKLLIEMPDEGLLDYGSSYY